MMTTVAAYQHSGIKLSITITDTGEKGSKGRFIVARECGERGVLPHCSAGRATEAEAREFANELWTNAVFRVHHTRQDTDAPVPGMAGATVIRLHAPSGNRDADYWQAQCSACAWLSASYPNRTVEGRKLADRAAAEHNRARHV